MWNAQVIEQSPAITTDKKNGGLLVADAKKSFKMIK